MGVWALDIGVCALEALEARLRSLGSPYMLSMKFLAEKS